jgi:hypothetical protein
MKPNAKVTSVDAIRDFQQRLRRYQEVVQEICESLGVETNRASDWIEHDRSQYWPNQWRRSENAVVAARNDLDLAKLAAMQNEHKSCIDEKKAVDHAVQRQRLCEDKMRLIKHWRTVMQHHTEEFRGKLSKLRRYCEVDLPRATASLDRILRSLDKYTESQSRSRSPGRITIHEDGSDDGRGSA